MEPAGRVDDENIDTTGQGAVAGIVGHARGISARGSLDDVGAGSSSPDRELVGRGRRNVSQAARRIVFPRP